MFGLSHQGPQTWMLRHVIDYAAFNLLFFFSVYLCLVGPLLPPNKIVVVSTSSILNSYLSTIICDRKLWELTRFIKIIIDLWFTQLVNLITLRLDNVSLIIADINFNCHMVLLLTSYVFIICPLFPMSLWFIMLAIEWNRFIL